MEDLLQLCLHVEWFKKVATVASLNNRESE